MKTKICNKCNSNKPASEFYKDRLKGCGLGLKHTCKECDNIRKMNWEKLNPMKITTNMRKQNLRKYWPGSTGKQALQEYKRLFAQQMGKCLICDKGQSEFEQPLSVDHNHITGEVRGLLCGECNRGLGCFRDNPTLLNNAANYLTCSSSSLKIKVL